MSDIQLSDPAVLFPLSIHFTLGAERLHVWVLPGVNRWEVVARAVSESLKTPTRTDDPPWYDEVLRTWVLNVKVLALDGHPKAVVSVPVQWECSGRAPRRMLN